MIINTYTIGTNKLFFYEMRLRANLTFSSSSTSILLMKKILSSAVLVFIFTSLTFAQSQPQYFKNAIIVKYQDEETLQKSNIAGATFVQQQVEDYLGTLGMTEIKPFWNNSKENILWRTLSEKRKLIPNNELTDDIRRIVEYQYTSEIDPMILADKLSKIPGIEYAEPRLIRQLSLTTDDPIKNSYETIHKFNEAWDITTGSSDVVIGIIDSGVNYLHSDMANKQWVNEGEIPENQIDDDGNGFVDDYLGWDFWEARSTIPVEADNDPFAEHQDHGTHVAGIAAADANNTIGLAGTGFNSRYMAIKAGGIEDDPNTDNDESRGIAFWDLAIEYGVLNGADVINMSFGGPGFSDFENDVIQFAVNSGVIMVGASGNSFSSEAFYPAAYDGVLNVGSITGDQAISNFSNHGYTVDVFAVGSSIRSTGGFGTTGFVDKSGTSMASPVVAGLAGLLRAQFPDWSPRRIIHQIRSTSVPFTSTLDPLFLGKGMIDAEAALTNLMPGISIRSFNITDSQGTSLSVGESGIIDLRLRNFGETTGALTITLESLQEEITVTSEPISVGVLETDTNLEVELEFDIPQNYDLNNVPTFVIRFEDAGLNYTDYDVVQFDNLSFGVMDANNITMSFSANGTIGVSDPSTASGGIGFIPEGNPNMLYEAGIMMAAGGNPFFGTEPEISNNVRGVGLYDNDFDPNNAFVVNSPGENATAQGTGTFSPNRFAELKGVSIRLNTFAFEDPEVENVVYSQYLIKNNTDEVIEDFYFGIFTDWDIDETTFGNNIVRFDASNEFLYIFDNTSGSSNPYISVDPMQGASAYHAIDNNYSSDESDFRFAVNDGYTDTEKINSLKAGTNVTNVGPADISSVVASGPYRFNPGVTIKLGFMYVYGSNYINLRDNLLAARDRNVFAVDEPGVYTSSELETEIPTITRLSQNYPNPFNPSTELNFELAEAGLTELSIYNILGQKVHTLVNEVRSAGSYTVNFDASRLNSGIYFAVLKSGDITQSIKMTLIK